MPSYDYRCVVCDHAYNEVRGSNDFQWVTKCPVNECEGNLVEVK